MNIFEDLIEELKEADLLETTTAEAARKTDSSAVAETETPEPAANNAHGDAVDKKAHEAEFYRQRATDEVSFLQMVEYVFAGVEREHLKIVPKPYDALEVKKLLHSFVQSAPETQAAELAQMQFQLLRETETWHSSLAARDRCIMTAHLRRYCEISRPPLSSPALVSLARFYRNSSYSETVRSKFDLVVTRLFSKEVGRSRRESVFKPDELATHIAELYADWSSVPLYSTDAEDSKIREIVNEFGDFMREADGAVDFDALINSDYFGRLYKFKESTNENFFAPPVVAVAVESNIRVGNLYLKLLENEKKRGSVVSLENKYGFAHDQTISEATGKTFALIELLNQKTVAPPKIEVKVPGVETVKTEPKAQSPIKEKTKEKSKENVKPTVEEPAAAPPFDKRLILLAAGFVLIMLILYFNS